MTPAQRRSAASKKAARSRKRKAVARLATEAEAPKRITKTARIKALLDAGKSRAEIAAEVGCKQSYVRAVYQRLKNPWPAGPDRRYIDRKMADPEWVAAHKKYRRDYQREYTRRRYATDPAYAERVRQKSRERWRRRTEAHV